MASKKILGLEELHTVLTQGNIEAAGLQELCEIVDWSILETSLSGIATDHEADQWYTVVSCLCGRNAPSTYLKLIPLLTAAVDHDRPSIRKIVPKLLQLELANSTTHGTGEVQQFYVFIQASFGDVEVGVAKEADALLLRIFELNEHAFERVFEFLWSNILDASGGGSEDASHLLRALEIVVKVSRVNPEWCLAFENRWNVFSTSLRTFATSSDPLALLCALNVIGDLGRVVHGLEMLINCGIFDVVVGNIIERRPFVFVESLNCLSLWAISSASSKEENQHFSSALLRIYDLIVSLDDLDDEEADAALNFFVAACIHPKRLALLSERTTGNVWFMELFKGPHKSAWYRSIGHFLSASEQLDDIDHEVYFASMARVFLSGLSDSAHGFVSLLLRDLSTYSDERLLILRLLTLLLTVPSIRPGMIYNEKFISFIEDEISETEDAGRVAKFALIRAAFEYVDDITAAHGESKGSMLRRLARGGPSGSREAHAIVATEST